MNRLATLAAAAALGVAGCDRRDDCACDASEGLNPPSGGYEAPGGPEEVSEYLELTADECRAFLATAEDNPASSLRVDVISGSLNSSWENDQLGYEETFRVENDSAYEDEARSIYACASWQIENSDVSAEWTGAFRQGNELYVSTEASPAVSEATTGLQVWILADEGVGHNDLRLVDTVIHPVDARSNPPEILE